MQYFQFLIKWLTGQCFTLHFGGPKPGKPAAPKAATPAPAAIAPPKEREGPVGTFNPEAERQGVATRPKFVLGSGERRKKFGQATTLGAGI